MMNFDSQFSYIEIYKTKSNLNHFPNIINYLTLLLVRLNLTLFPECTLILLFWLVYNYELWFFKIPFLKKLQLLSLLVVV